MMANHKALSGALALLMVVFIASKAQPGESLPTLSGAFSCAKNIVETVKTKLINRSSLVVAYKARLQVVKERYEAARRAGALDGMDDQAKSDYYYQIVFEELRKLRLEIERSSPNGKPIREDLSGPEDAAIYKCAFNPDKVHEGWSPAEASHAMDEDLDEDREAELLAELSELQTQAAKEAEMGWSMDDGTKAILLERTRSVVTELLNEELRHLAVALVQSYLAGGTMGPVMVAVSAGLKSKLAEYFMNGILDVIASIFGKRVEITPITTAVPLPTQMDIDETATVKPAEADQPQPMAIGA